MNRTMTHSTHPGRRSKIATRDPQRDKPSCGEVQHRRRLLTAIAAAGVAGTTLPDRWSKPVVDAVLLPAHAQATPGCVLTCISAIEETWVLEGNSQTSNLAVDGLSRATIVQCISANGDISISSTTFQDSGFDAQGRITELTFSTGTISTASILGTYADTTYTGTSFVNSFIPLATTTGFQSAC